MKELEKVGDAKYWDKLDSCLDRMTFDEAFYHLAGLDFQIRFDEFYFERDLEKEEEVCKTLRHSEQSASDRKMPTLNVA